jgi:hypothetical protein
MSDVIEIGSLDELAAIGKYPPAEPGALTLLIHPKLPK